MTNEVTESNTRENAFKTIYTLINNNKLTGTTVLAGFSNDSIAMPCYVINPALVRLTSPTKDKTMNNYNLSIEVELWCKSNDLKAKIDQMKDNLQSTMLNNLSTLNTQNLNLTEDWFDDSNVDTVEFDMVKYHTGAVILSFELL